MAAVSQDSASRQPQPAAPVAPHAATDVLPCAPLGPVPIGHPPLDLTSPQFTLRAVLTGAVLGGVLAICNLCVGLKVGLPLNMSITGALLGWGVWTSVHHLSGRRIAAWGLLENNTNQTACSAGAFIASAGLITSIPTLAIMTGQTLAWGLLTSWLLSVCLLGILLAASLRKHMIEHERLAFPVGVASAETLRGLHAHGRDALARVSALLGGAVVGSAVELIKLWRPIGALALPGSVRGTSLASLGLAFDPSPLAVALGGLIGFRTCASLLVGSLFAFAILVPIEVARGNIAAPGYRPAVPWLVWPGVTLMVVSALASLAFSWRALGAAVLRPWTSSKTACDGGSALARRAFLAGLLLALALSVALQMALFGIAWWAALLSVALALVLGLMAARVVGETGISPVAPLGKLSQFTLGALVRQSPVPNLMAANVTGGAASQCGDLLQDLKCGYLVGARPALQVLAQLCGAAAGAVVGSAFYLWLIPNPAQMLPSEQWPAPAVVGMKAVATLFLENKGTLPAGAELAMWIAGVVAVLLAIGERWAPERTRRWVPSGASLGLAFVLPPSLSLTIFVGGLVALAAGRLFKTWMARFLITLCTGLIVGDTLTGTGNEVYRLLAGLR